MSKLNKAYFPALTGVRALAATMVYVHHFNPFHPALSGKTVFEMANELHIGVTLFFVLSGFLIAHRYSEMQDFNFKKYMVNRIARIYPMYFLLTTVTFLVLNVFNDYSIDFKDVMLYLANITFLRGFFSFLKFTLIAQGWSLTVEEVFYILAPLIFLLVNRRRIMLLLLPAGFILFGVALVSVFKNYNFGGFFHSYEFMFNYTFFGRAIEFFAGIGLALLLKKYPGYKSRYPLTYIGMFFIILCIWLISLFAGEDFGIRHPAGIFINTLILPVFGIAVFYLGLLTEQTKVSRFFSSKLVVLLGKSSYIFYLIHLGIFRDALPSTGIVLVDYIYMFVVLQIASIFLFRFIEEPANLLIRRRFNMDRKQQ